MPALGRQRMLGFWLPSYTRLSFASVSQTRIHRKMVRTPHGRGQEVIYAERHRDGVVVAPMAGAMCLRWVENAVGSIAERDCD
jgi:hypothetical protein